MSATMAASVGTATGLMSVSLVPVSMLGLKRLTTGFGTYILAQSNSDVLLKRRCALKTHPADYCVIRNMCNPCPQTFLLPISPAVHTQHNMSLTFNLISGMLCRVKV